MKICKVPTALFIGYRSLEWAKVSPETKQMLHEGQLEGDFWMPWDEFYTYFCNVTIGQYTPDYDSDGIPEGLGN